MNLLGCRFSSDLLALPAHMHAYIKRNEPRERNQTKWNKERIIVQLFNFIRIFHSQRFLCSTFYCNSERVALQAARKRDGDWKRHLFCRLHGFAFAFFISLGFARPDFDKTSRNACCTFLPNREAVNSYFRFEAIVKWINYRWKWFCYSWRLVIDEWVVSENLNSKIYLYFSRNN